jgi:hypothetical protein
LQNEHDEDAHQEQQIANPRDKQAAQASENERKNALAVLAKTNAENEARTREFTLKKLKPAVGYCISIRAHNCIGWSQATASDRAGIAWYYTGSARPSMPTNLRVLDQGSVVQGSKLKCHLHFGWDPPATDNGAPIDKYDIELMRNVFSYVGGILCETDSFLELGTKVLSAPAYIFGGLNPGVTHRARVRVHNGCGWTDYTDWLFAKTIGCPPDAPLPFGRAFPLRAAWKGGVMIFGEWGVPIPNGEPIDAYEMQVGIL